MKIAFWSNARGTCGVTSNLACISVISALMGRQKAVLLENHLHLNHLELILNQSLERNLVKEYTYYSQIGIDQLMRRIHSGLDLERAVLDCSIPITERLCYLPQNDQMNPEQFNYEFGQVVYPMLSLLEKQGYIIYFDLEQTNSLSSKIVLNEADIVVVNLCQNPAVLEDFFEQHLSLKRRAFYVVGAYSPQSATTISMIQRKYQIEPERIGRIPYSAAFANAMNQGRLVSFLKQNYREGRKGEYRKFMEEVKETTRLLWEFNSKRGGRVGKNFGF